MWRLHSCEDGLMQRLKSIQSALQTVKKSISGKLKHSMKHRPIIYMSFHLSSCASNDQISAVFTEVDLLNAEPRVVTVRVKTANLHNKKQCQ